MVGQNSDRVNNALALKDIVMWVLGALMSVLLLFGNKTLNSIEAKLTNYDAIILRHERELGGVDDLKKRMDNMEDRERDGLRVDQRDRNAQNNGGSR